MFISSEFIIVTIIDVTYSSLKVKSVTILCLPSIQKNLYALSVYVFYYI